MWILVRRCPGGGWNSNFSLFHGKRYAAEMGAPELKAFLTHLAVQENVAASTQNQAR